MKIELSSIVENQLPQYVREEYPLAGEFLKQYYYSDNANKIVQNIDSYLDLDVIFEIPESTILLNSVDFDDDTLAVESTRGFPETYGLLKIDDEIITYTSKTDTSFEGCIRGFSGVERGQSNKLIFNQTQASLHSSESKVYNLSSFFLKEFLFGLKQKIAPGFENRELFTSLNQANFLKRLKDFYQTKGTEESFRILFAALYGVDVKVLLPRDRLFSASNAQYRVSKKLVVDALQGNPKELVNGTIYQDGDGFIVEARGTITYVEEIVRNNKNYYIISLDFDYDKDIDVSGTLKSEFTIHPQTVILSDVVANSTYIDVDSTVGFPNSGSLVFKKPNGEDLIIQYTSKNLNQFLGCSGITSAIKNGSNIRLNTFAYGYNSNQEQIKLRVTGVLDKPEFIGDNYSYKTKEEFNIETLGYPSYDLRANDWEFNIPLSYTIVSIEIADQSDLSYKVTTIDDCVFSVGDSCVLVENSNTEIHGTVLNIFNDKSIIASFDNLVDLNKTYTIRKNITKTNFEGVPELSIYNANVQNTYIDEEKNVYVLSPSLPSYLNTSLTTNIGKIVFSGSFTDQIILEENHPFFTGDSVVYRPASSTNKLFNEGIYFVKKIDERTIKFALSRENLYNQNYITFSGSVTNSSLEFFEFTGNNLEQKTIQPQNLIRKLVIPMTCSDKTVTPLSAVGILKNGVEIMNYKSQHQIFYGPVIKIVSSAPGNNYDIINPPQLTVTDNTGSGAIVYPTVSGNLKKIDLTDSGFDYLDDPTIEIIGGNGKNALAKANLIEFEHVEFFNADTDVSVSLDTIGFSTYHKFRQGEEVIYNPNNQTALGNIVANEKYFIHTKNGLEISIHKNRSDAVTGINSINITSKSTGLHSLKAIDKKQKIGSISIINPGDGYTNRKNYISGIVTESNTLEIKDHKFNSGEIVYYTTTGTVSTGLTNNTQYYVKVVDSDHVQLSNLNSNDPRDFYYKTENYVGITSFSSANQYLSYPPINVQVKGRIGIATFDNANFNAKVIPAFRGGIEDVTLEFGGSSYGSEDILDYNIEPKVNVSKGSGAQIKPVINNGRITSVIIQYSGTNYTSTPDLIVQGDGYNAVLTPIVQNGLIVDVKIISGGFNYTAGKTTITVITPGEGAQFRTTIKSWRINLFEKYNRSNYFSDDDGVILNALNQNTGLQYYHLFAPRKLRQSVYTRRSISGNIIFEQDLKLDSSGREINSTLHSPIIGWAYDGNPIYGPYAYSSRFGSTTIKQLNSGYTLKSNSALTLENRPNSFPVGFFVEDYEYTGAGDLDEHNGRYCVTPEYPNGVYAYFATFETTVETTGSFVNYKKPQFPYVVGNSYYAETIPFNFNTNSNQNSTNIESLNVLRNTTPYNLKSDNTIYDGLIAPYKIKNDIFSIKTVTPAKIDKIDVISSGDGYSVNSIIELDGDNTAKISKITGKTVTSIASSDKIAENLEILSQNGLLIGYSSVPHQFINNEIVNFSAYTGQKTQKPVKITNNQLIISTGILSSGDTASVVYLSVYGNLSEAEILPNDIYNLGQEELKVLNIEPENSRIRVQRDYNGTVGINSYPVGTAITEKTRKLAIDNDLNLNSGLINREYYFIPSESVGLGNTFGVGITSTLYFSNPGTGATFAQIPTRSILIPNHKLQTNDKLIYEDYNNTPIFVATNGISSVSLSVIPDLFVAKFDDNVIGLSSYPIGIGSLGTFVGIGSTTNLLAFVRHGTGNYHSFKTDYEVLAGDALRQEITVSLASTHNLKISDDIQLDVVSGISTTIKFKYSDIHKRILSKESIIQNVDIKNNILRFSQHSFVNGEKVVYIPNTQNISGILSNQIYYAIVINKFKIKLATSKYDATIFNSVDIQSLGDGSILSINPKLNLEKNSIVSFDLSDSSLGYTRGGFSYPAFNFDVYCDYNYATPYFNNRDTKDSLFSKSGQIGVDSGAKATLSIKDNTRTTIFYNFSPVDSSIPAIKYGIVNDLEQVNHNTLHIKFPVINQKYKVKNTTSSTFTCDSKNIDDTYQYTSATSNISYDTNSINDVGGIKDIQITKNNHNNYSLPNITNLETLAGKGAKLEVSNIGIGSIKNITINDIGFEYSTDKTVKPKLNLPKIVKAEPLYTIDRVEVVNTPVTYYTPPQLVLIDNFNNNPIIEAVFDYSPTQQTVSVLKNTQEIVGTQPYLIPTNNSVGIAISNISYNSATKDVTVVLDSEFSDIGDFPFEVGKKVLIENVIVGDGDQGYNSSLYNYALFEIKNIDPNIGGFGATFGYSMSEYLTAGEVLGSYKGLTLKGNAVPEKYIPTFEVFLTRNDFVLGENIYSAGANGVIIDQNLTNNYIKVLTEDTLTIGNKLTGQTSKTTILISDIVEFEGYLNIKSTSEVVDGWKRETGFFNNNLQRLHDNDYYQYFSYSLNSTIEYRKWNEVVSDLVHPSGFKKFSDLIVYTEISEAGITTQESFEHISVNDINIDLNMNCIDNFDLVRENSFNIDGSLSSNEIYFESVILQDYIESISNRVLSIDEVVVDFANQDISFDYEIVDTFDTTEFYYKRYFVFIRDKWYEDKTNFSIINVLVNQENVINNQYAELTTGEVFGSFGYGLADNQYELIFLPTDLQNSSYYINTFSYCVGKNALGISSVGLGSVARIQYSGATHNIGIGTTTIVGISSSVRAAKFMIGIAFTNNSHYELNELSLVGNGTDVKLVAYGDLIASPNTNGIGTYHAYYNGNNINIDLIPNNVGTGTQYYVNTHASIINNRSFVGVGSTTINQNTIVSTAVTTSGGISTALLSYPKSNTASYNIVCIENLTTSQCTVLEFVDMYNEGTNQTYYTSYAINNTAGQLGIISSYVSGNSVIIAFKPNNSEYYSVRGIHNIIVPNNNESTVAINTSFSIDSNYSNYESPLYGVNDNFELLHNNQPIFIKPFNAQSHSGVSVTENTIRLPNHFFVTGEEVSYEYDNTPIGIGTTFIVGVGTTSLLPSTVYLVKVNDLDVRVAASASDALAAPARTLNITAIGIGTSHSFVATSQNVRSLITVDNMIQSPIVSTGTTTFLTREIKSFDSKISVNSSDLIVSGDFLKIDNEIVKVLAVGVGSTNTLLVDRSRLGTGIATHSQNTLTTKIKGNYNIIRNSLYYEAPRFVSNEEYLYNYTFGGRVFNRSGDINSQNKTYYDNYIFDDISSSFDGKTKIFKLTNNKNEVDTTEDRNAIVLINGIFQSPKFEYNITENVGVSSIVFTGAATSVTYDVNNASIPRGGIIVSAGSTQGFGYQPLVSAGGTALVSAAGTIQSISIGNSGSGYRNGVQTVRVGVQTESSETPSIQFIGTATVTNGRVVSVAITNPGIGYTNFTTNYTSYTDSIVSIGSTIIPFNVTSGVSTTNRISVGTAITNAIITGIGSTAVMIGTAFTANSLISVATTVSIKTYNPPKVIFDDPLPYSNIPLISSGSGVEGQVNIVVGQGSSVISFEIINSGYGYKVGEALNIPVGGSVGIPTDTSKPYIPFKLNVSEVFNDKFSSWVVGDLQPLDSFDDFFNGSRRNFQLRISNNPVSIQKRKGSDLDLSYNLLIFINDILQIPGESYTFNGGSIVSFNEPPAETDTSRVIFYRGTSQYDTLDVDIIEEIKIGDNVTINSEDIDYQQNGRLVTDILSVDTLETYLYSGPGVSEDETRIRPLTLCQQTEDLILNGQIIGKNRVTLEPIITPATRIISPVSIGATQIFVENVRSYFDNKNEYLDSDTQHRSVTIISLDDSNLNYETISNVYYDGDFGKVTGIKTATIGVGSTGLVFQFYIPPTSPLRQENYIISNVSGISTGFYFVVSNSNIENGIRSLNNDESVIGIGTTFIDNVYRAYSVSIAQTGVPGIGVTAVVEVTAKVDRFVTGIGYSNYYGDFSWGRLHSFNRKDPTIFNLNSAGLSTSPVVLRTKPLKYENYYI